MTGWAALDRLLTTEPDDAGCEAAMRLLHVYAELLAHDHDAARVHYPDVAAHIRSCGPCAEDLEGLLRALELTVESATARRRAVTDRSRDYPRAITPVDHVEPAPRRVRATLGGRQIFDTLRAHYVWEWPFYPQYYIPVEDVDGEYLVDEHRTQDLRRGPARRFGLRAGEQVRPRSVRIFGSDAAPGIAGAARFDWDALDAWYEEDEQIFVHPRSPYVRVDALRAHRHVRVALDGVVLAETATPVLVFETGLPTRYYVDRTDVAFEYLVHTDTQTACPYKGVTSDYWSVQLDANVRAEHRDLAWSYDYPTRQLLPVTGLVAFYNEKVDIQLDGVLLPRPQTHFTS